MAKTQTRRSVSMSRESYEKLAMVATETGSSMSQIVETSVRYHDVAKLALKNKAFASELEGLVRAYSTIETGKSAQGEVSP